MKILFFTPVSTASAIARFSQLIVGALQTSGHIVTVVRAEAAAPEDVTSRTFAAHQIDWRETKAITQLTRQSDLLVYQIGDNFQFHRGALEWLLAMPGLVCLHDVFLGSLFWAWSDLVGRPKATAALTALYGEHTAAQFFNHASAESFIAFASNSAPMTEWVVSHAHAVILHSSWGNIRATNGCRGPVNVLPLAYNSLQTHASSDIRSVDHKKFTVLTVGHANSNKRYHTIIEAIGSSGRLRDATQFRIVGSIQPQMQHELQALADSLSAEIVVTGSVPDQVLAQEINDADVVCCLRLPALEGASASTIEAMLNGKATLVINTGFYLDLPGDCVVKISPERELIELREGLELLMDRPQERRALGEFARNYALKTFRADRYASEIVKMHDKIERYNLISGAASSLVAQMRQWGYEGDPEIANVVAAPIANVF